MNNDRPIDIFTEVTHTYQSAACTLQSLVDAHSTVTPETYTSTTAQALFLATAQLVREEAFRRIVLGGGILEELNLPIPFDVSSDELLTAVIASHFGADDAAAFWMHDVHTMSYDRIRPEAVDDAIEFISEHIEKLCELIAHDYPDVTFLKDGLTERTQAASELVKHIAMHIAGILIA